jgi:hypothetical protein
VDLHPPAHPPEAPEGERLPVDQQVILGAWSVQVVADELQISEEAARDLLEAAYAQGRVQILGNGHFAGVAVDGKWVVVEGRYQLQQAAAEWATLRAMERQFEPPPE